MGQNKDKFCSP